MANANSSFLKMYSSFSKALCLKQNLTSSNHFLNVGWISLKGGLMILLFSLVTHLNNTVLFFPFPPTPCLVGQPSLYKIPPTPAFHSLTHPPSLPKPSSCSAPAQPLPCLKILPKQSFSPTPHSTEWGNTVVHKITQTAKIQYAKTHKSNIIQQVKSRR